MIRLIAYIFFLGCVFNAAGQSLESKVSQSELLIGQPIIISYEVKFNKDDSIFFSPKQDIIKARSITNSSDLTTTGIDFEITQAFQDTFIFKDKLKTWIGKYVVTAWDSGMFIIPGQSVIINDSSFTFPDLAIASYLTDPIDGMDIYDIKENYADIPPLPFDLVQFIQTNWWWLLIVVFGIILFFTLRKKKTVDEVDELKPMSLKERTLIAIDALESAKLWEKEQLKEHFVELSYILRSYLTARYNITLLEKTTHETKILLTEKGLNDETVDIVARILSQSDMVKFAKSKPDTIAILRISTLAKQIVAETSPLEFDNVE